MVEQGLSANNQDLAPKRETSHEIQNDSERRCLREVESSEFLDEFIEDQEKSYASEEGLRKVESLARMLDRVKWGKVLTDLEVGDRVLTFLTPGVNFLKIKHLNDNIFGSQITTDIIKERARLLRRAVGALNEGVDEDKTISVLDTNYKMEVIRVPKESKINLSQVRQLMADIDIQMTLYINAIVEKLKSKEESGAVASAQTLHEFQDSLLGKEDKQHHGKKGFRMNYGVATVEEKNFEGVIGALGRSLQASHLARRTKGIEYGLEYSEDLVLEELSEIQKIRDKIINNGNVITNIDGDEFTVFSSVTTDKRGQIWQIDKDLLREIRKEKFEVKEGDQELLDTITLYTKKLNILDMVKPFVLEKREEVMTTVLRAKELSKKLREKKTLSDEDKKDLVKILRTDERCKDFTSKMEFDRRAVGMENAAYINMDVLDLGVDQLLEHEATLQSVEAIIDKTEKMKAFNQAVLEAGDLTTKELKKIWQQIAEVVGGKEFNLRKMNDLITAHREGDEVVIAIDIGEEAGQIKSDSIIKLLIALKKGTNRTRIAKTRISEREKHVDGTSTKAQKVKEHLKAKKGTEKGHPVLKDIEAVARKMEHSKKKGQQIEIGGLEGIFALEDGQVVSKVMATIIAGKDIIVVNDNGDQIFYSSIKPRLDGLLRRKAG